MGRIALVGFASVITATLKSVVRRRRMTLSLCIGSREKVELKESRWNLLIKIVTVWGRMVEFSMNKVND